MTKILNNRNEFSILINEREYKTVIEIGVAMGGFANILLRECPCIEKYYGIDPFGDNNIDVKRGIDVAIERLKKYGDKVILIRKQSQDAINDFEDNSIDFIYIDGDHRYEAVKNDLDKYWKKLKIGGILAGHDYDKRQLGVVQAVDKFINEMSLELHLTGLQYKNEFDDKEFGGLEADAISWWIEKF